MKKLFTIFALLIFLAGKSNGQTQFPFYGFELSNYEVGDTLEYISSTSAPGSANDAFDTDIYRIFYKEQILPDTIIYSIEDSYSYEQVLSNVAGKDTLKIKINNDTIYNNYNNILRYLLVETDTVKGSYFKYDTIAGLKTLMVHANPIWAKHDPYYYDAIQNLGIRALAISQLDNDYFFYDTLTYANLVHYGIYGKLTPVILGINNPIHISSSTSIHYDYNMSAWLNISSGQNLNNPVLSIYDLLGRNVKTQQVNTGSNLVDMQTLPKGMYLYKVESKGNVLGQGKLMNLTN